MHYLVIGEGQVGREVVSAALERDDTVTIFRRSAVDDANTRADYGPGADSITRITGDVLDVDAVEAAAAGAAAVFACFHTDYDSRVWRRDLPGREHSALDAAARVGVPVVFPESMYGFIGEARDLREGAGFSPREDKGRIRQELIEARRAHPARTVSVVASDLIGPTGMTGGAAVACATVLQPLAAGSRPFIPGDPSVPHSLTFTPDLARAMLVAADNADALATGGRDAVVHAPTDTARTFAELVEFATDALGAKRYRMIAIPHVALRMFSLFDRTMRELSAISDLWYRPCSMAPGVLTTEYGLEPTGWEDAVLATIAAADTKTPGRSSV